MATSKKRRSKISGTITGTLPGRSLLPAPAELPASAAPRDVNISKPLPGMIDSAASDGRAERPAWKIFGTIIRRTRNHSGIVPFVALVLDRCIRFGGRGRKRAPKTPSRSFRLRNGCFENGPVTRSLRGLHFANSPLNSPPVSVRPCVATEIAAMADGVLKTHRTKCGVPKARRPRPE
jgi:hypothetical protein